MSNSHGYATPTEHSRTSFDLLQIGVVILLVIPIGAVVRALRRRRPRSRGPPLRHALQVAELRARADGDAVRDEAATGHRAAVAEADVRADDAALDDAARAYVRVVEDVRVAQDRAGPDRAPLADDGRAHGRVRGDRRVRADERVVPDLTRPVLGRAGISGRRGTGLGECGACPRGISTHRERTTELSFAMYLLPRRCS